MRFDYTTLVNKIFLRKGKHIVIAVSCIVLLFHFYLIVKYSVNIPYWDDYDSILHFLNNYLASNSFNEKFDLIVARHNEHRIIFNRLVTIIQFYLFGNINFKALVLFGNLLLVVFFVAVFFKHLKNRPLSWIEFLPVPFIIFILNSYEAFLWPMVALGTFGVILFSFLSILILFQESNWNYKIRFSLAFLAATLAAYTNGNGFLTLIICQIGLFLQRINYRYLLFWGIGTLIVLYLNFRGFEPIPYHPNPLATLQNQPDKLISHFFVLLGNYFQTNGNLNYTLILFSGFFIFGLFLYYFIPQKLYNSDPVTFYFLVFLILSCAITSLNRAGFGVTQAFSPRYQIYSSLIILFTYFLFLKMPLSGFRCRQTVILVFFMICVLNYFQAIKMKLISISDTQFALTNGALSARDKKTSTLAFPDQPTAVNILAKSKETGVYALPPMSYRDIAVAPIHLEMPAETNTIDNDWTLSRNDSLILIENGWAYVEGHSYINSQTYVVLRSSAQQYIFATYRHFRPDVTAAKSSGNLDWSGFSLVADRFMIQPGVYKVGFLIKETTFLTKSNYGLEFTDRVLVNKLGTPLEVLRSVDYNQFVPQVTDSRPEYYLDSFEQKGNNLKIRGWAFLSQIHSESVQLSLELLSEKHSIILPASKEVRGDVAAAFHGNYSASGFFCEYDLAHASKGEYHLNIILTCMGVRKEIVTEKKLKLN